MTRFRQLLYLFTACLLLGVMLSGYYLWHRYYVQPFSCQANLVQHHPEEKLSLWLNYIFDGNSGTLSMNASVDSDPTKIIDRKIFFRVERKDNVFLLTSVRHMKFPDDNVTDNWLEKYEPQFFVYPGKSIYFRINEQQNGNYIFTLGTLPTYVCRSSKKG
ncbi:hypothetical protein PYW49_19695 [Enterobacter sp. 170198]|jgi:hypothetical protein|uniref:Inner membrane protein n=1 Tax=Enterobacter chinensis TaxID=3030997 RepID=A0ABU5D7D7_9ENTR|nr:MULTISPECIES: hypothetical protein [Enterobacteriaceae]MDY0419877.1 hypothetical protein [Enterobacter sp. 170198]TFB26483.1 hypothetical protein E3U32_07835 [Lelliottia nimipressuralis]